MAEQANTQPAAGEIVFTPVAAPTTTIAHVHGPGCGHDHGHEHGVGIACACGHDHAHEEGEGGGHSHSGLKLNIQLTLVLPLTIAALVLAYGLELSQGANAISTALGLFAVAIAGGPIIWSAIKGVARGQTNVNELVSLAIIGAVWLDMPLEAGLVALILQIGALIEGVATEGARNAVLALTRLAPKHARVKGTTDAATRGHGDAANGGDRVVLASEVREGDIVIVGPGESFAADGTVLSGVSSVDESSVTGESVPTDKHPGSEVLAGTINLSGSVEVQVERVGEHSALGQTIALVKRAQAFQPQIIRAADKFFAFYTPIILGASLVVLWATQGDLKRMVTMWVVGCPCAMLLASPLAIVVSLARASRSGITVKAGPFFEASANLDTVVFDKTGTLTSGKFVIPTDGVRPVPGVTTEELLRVAATVEDRSQHPIAKAIVAYAKAKGAYAGAAAEVRVLEGLGVEGVVDGETVRAGSLRIVPTALVSEANKLEHADETQAMVPVYVMKGPRLLGAIHLTDEVRPEADGAIRRLRRLGVRRIVMLTGDRRRTAELVGRQVGCDEVFAELLPAQKVELVRQLQRGGRGVAMVGDGINDAPSLKAATVGIAMGGIRKSDVAIHAADAIVMNDDLTRVPLMVYLAKQTRSAIYQNLAFAVVFTTAIEALIAMGVIPWVLSRFMHDTEAGRIALFVAGVGHVLGVVVIALNSVRLAGTGKRRVSPVAAVETVTPALQPAMA